MTLMPNKSLMLHDIQKCISYHNFHSFVPMSERIYNPITAMGFSSMFISHLEVNIDGNPFAVMGVVDTFEPGVHVFWQIVVRK